MELVTTETLEKELSETTDPADRTRLRRRLRALRLKNEGVSISRVRTPRAPIGEYDGESEGDALKRLRTEFFELNVPLVLEPPLEGYTWHLFIDLKHSAVEFITKFSARHDQPPPSWSYLYMGEPALPHVMLGPIARRNT